MSAIGVLLSSWSLRRQSSRRTQKRVKWFGRLLETSIVFSNEIKRFVDQWRDSLDIKYSDTSIFK